MPPERYGGVEWIVSLLADGLAELGHDVTLFAAGGSFTRAQLETTLPEAVPFQYGQSLPELEHVLGAYRQVRDFDVVNDHSGLIAASLADLAGAPVCHTVHTPLTGREGDLYRGISALNPGLRFISMTMHQREPAPELPWLANCPSAIDLDAYPFAPRRGEYLACLGRMSAVKGAGHAIAVAKALGMPLKLAGKMHEVAEREYFTREIAPHLGDGVEYLGEVTHEEKVRLLQGARCTLFPIEWEEPFGLVMIESMACGTPVAAVRRGAVPEVIDDGVSGIVVDDVADLADAVARADAIAPEACREHVEEHFSDRRMVRRYLDAYRLLLAP